MVLFAGSARRRRGPEEARMPESEPKYTDRVLYALDGRAGIDAGGLLAGHRRRAAGGAADRLFLLQRPNLPRLPCHFRRTYTTPSTPPCSICTSSSSPRKPRTAKPSSSPKRPAAKRFAFISTALPAPSLPRAWSRASRSAWRLRRREHQRADFRSGGLASVARCADPSPAAAARRTGSHPANVRRLARRDGGAAARSTPAGESEVSKT